MTPQQQQHRNVTKFTRDYAGREKIIKTLVNRSNITPITKHFCGHYHTILDIVIIDRKLSLSISAQMSVSPTLINPGNPCSIHRKIVEDL